MEGLEEGEGEEGELSYCDAVAEADDAVSGTHFRIWELRGEVMEVRGGLLLRWYAGSSAVCTKGIDGVVC